MKPKARSSFYLSCSKLFSPSYPTSLSQYPTPGTLSNSFQPHTSFSSLPFPIYSFWLSLYFEIGSSFVQTRAFIQHNADRLLALNSVSQPHFRKAKSHYYGESPSECQQFWTGTRPVNSLKRVHVQPAHCDGTNTVRNSEEWYMYNPATITKVWKAGKSLLRLEPWEISAILLLWLSTEYLYIHLPKD